MAGKSASILVKILGDESGLSKALADSEGKLDSFSKRMDATGKKMQGMGQKMTLGVTLPIVAGLGLATKWAGELEDSQAAAGEVFGDAADDMDAWADNAAKNFGLSKGEALEWSTQMGIRLTEIGGMSEEAAATQAQTLTQLAGDMASFFGGTTADAATAINSALTGEFEPLKRYGVIINDNALKAEYFALTGEEVTGTLSGQQKQLATLSLVMKGTDKVQGDYARNADGATNSQRTMTAALKDAGTEIGTVLLPFVTSLTTKIADMAKGFSNLNPGVQTAVVVFAGLAAAAGPMLYLVGTVMRSVEAVRNLGGALVTTTKNGDVTTRSLTNVGKAAAGLGAVGAAIAVYQLGNALNEATKDAIGLETAINNLKVAEGPKDVAQAIQDAAASSEGWIDHLRDIGNFFGGSMWDQGAIEVEGLRVELDNVDDVLKAVKATGDDELLAQTIAAFREADTSSVKAIGAVDRFNATLDDYEKNVESSGKASKKAAEDTEELAGGMEEGEDAAVDFNAELKTLNEQLRELSGGARDADEAQRDLLDANEDLTKAFEENGDTLNILTDAGRRNMDALEDQIDASFELADKQMELDSTGQTARRTLDAQAESLRQLRVRGIIPTDEEYNRLLHTYGLTPDQITTRIEANTKDASQKAFLLSLQLQNLPGVPAPLRSEIQAAIMSGDYARAEFLLQQVAREREARVRVVPFMSPGTFFSQMFPGFRADGGPVRKGHPYIVGEEGPELVIPDHNGMVVDAGKTAAMVGRRGSPVGAAGGSTVVNLNFYGPVAQDSVRWVTDQIETAVAKGLQMPRLQRSLVG